MEHVSLTPEQERARKRRNVLLALAIAGFAVLLFFVALARMHGAGA